MATQAKLQLEVLNEEASSRAMTAAELKPILEAIIYVAEEPISEATLLTLLGKEHQEAIREALRQLLERYQSPECGLEIREVAGGYKLATKAEHHDWVRKYVKQHTPPTKLSLAALETLAVIAYRQPITVPEIQDVRGVNAVSVLKTLLDKKLITTSGRKNVIGRPILYRTTKEFLVHFGLKNLDELPSLEEFEELARSASDSLAEASVTEAPVGEDLSTEMLSRPGPAMESVSADEAIAEETGIVAHGPTLEEALAPSEAAPPGSLEVAEMEAAAAGTIDEPVDDAARLEPSAEGYTGELS
jgi:segregation and condensation protein B